MKNKVCIEKYEFDESISLQIALTIVFTCFNQSLIAYKSRKISKFLHLTCPTGTSN